MPPILVVLGFVLFWGNAGALNRAIGTLSRLIGAAAGIAGAEPPTLRVLYRPLAIVLAHAFYNFPLVIRLCREPLSRARSAFSAPAATLGASPVVAAVTVVLPAALSAILSAAALVFLYCFTSFSIVLVLGGGPAATTLAVEIYRYARVSLDYHTAGLLAIAETLIAGAAFAAYLFFEKQSGAVMPAGEIVSRPLSSVCSKTAAAVRRAAATLYLAIMCLVVAGPLFSLVVQSFLFKGSRSAAASLSLHWWASLGDSIAGAFLRSVSVAALAATLAVALAAIAAYTVAALSDPARHPVRGRHLVRSRALPSVGGHLLRALFCSPLASSGIVLAFGWLCLYGRDSVRSVLPLVAVHAVSALPFAFNSVYGGLRAIPANILGAASVLGAAPTRRFFSVELPLSAASMRSAWGFAAAISLGELNAPLMLGMEAWETLPLYIYRAAGAYRYGTACTAGVLLLACILLAFLLSEFSPVSQNREDNRVA
jgi:thiamine transport system permease protein